MAKAIKDDAEAKELLALIHNQMARLQAYVRTSGASSTAVSAAAHALNALDDLEIELE
jgi:hypothetical protein